MDKLNFDKITLRKFGMTMAVAFLAVSILFLLRQKYAGFKYSLSFSCVFFILGIFLPSFLKLAYIVWMRLALILGWVNTRIILIVIFFLIFTPIGLIMRIFKLDLLGRDKRERTYWKIKEKLDLNPLNYERRF